MVFKHFSNLNGFNRGITLIEVMVVVFIIVMFSLVVIADFPKVQIKYALSTVTHALAQDLRKAEDLALSGVKVTDSAGNYISVKGYGVYANTNLSTTKYLIYADVATNNSTCQDNTSCPSNEICVSGYCTANHKYDGSFSTTICSEQSAPTTDCPVQIIDVSQTNASLYISSITDSSDNNILGTAVSVNFVPPDPTVNIIDNSATPVSYLGIKIVLGILGNTANARTVYVNNHGLISAQ